MGEGGEKKRREAWCSALRCWQVQMKQHQCVCVCVCVCLCVCECEREREWMCICVFASLCKSVCYVRESVCVLVCGGGMFKCVFAHVFAYFRLFVCSWIPPGCAHSHPYSCGWGSFAFWIAAALSIVAPPLWLGSASSGTHRRCASGVWPQLCWRASGRHSNRGRELGPWSVSWRRFNLTSCSFVSYLVLWAGVYSPSTHLGAPPSLFFLPACLRADGSRMTPWVAFWRRRPAAAAQLQ